MKPVKHINLIMIVVCLTAWGVVAHETNVENGSFAAEQLNMIEEQIILTDAQSIAVQNIVIAGKNAMAEIIKSHGLQHGDMRKMQQGLKKFKELDNEKLAAILNQKQLQALREKIFANGPLGFMPLSDKEKLTCLQEILELSREKANQVAIILEQDEVQDQNLLDNSDINPALLMAFQHDMAHYQQEMKRSLSRVLSKKQMGHLSGLNNQINLKHCDLASHSWPKENSYDA